MAYIKKLKNNELIGGTDNNDVYPITSTQAVYNSDNVNQDYINNNIVVRGEDAYTEEEVATIFNSIT